MKKILISTGGTGGHVFPAIALGAYLEKCGYKVHYSVDQRGQKYAKFPQDSTHVIDMTSPPSGRWAKIKYYFNLAYSIIPTITIIRKIHPDVVIGFGGYASFPVVFAASLIGGVKIILHESNGIIGKANDYLLSRAQYLATGFATIKRVNIFQKKKICHTGTPVRQEIMDAKNTTELTPENQLKILVFGGSQAASIFTSFVPQAVVALANETRSKIHIFHQCKESEVKELKDYYIKNHISCDVESFFSDMDIKYSEASIVVARAGASTISELIATNTPSILIPLARSAKDHQLINAQYLEAIGGAIMLTEDQLRQGLLNEKLLALVRHKDIYFNMKVKLAEINIDWKAKLLTLIES